MTHVHVDCPKTIRWTIQGPNGTWSDRGDIDLDLPDGHYDLTYITDRDKEYPDSFEVRNGTLYIRGKPWKPRETQQLGAF